MTQEEKAIDNTMKCTPTCPTPAATPCVPDDIECLRKNIRELDLRDQDFDQRLQNIENLVGIGRPYTPGDFLFTSGFGRAGSTQSAVALAMKGLITSGEIEAAIFAGGGQFTSDIDADWAAFISIITSGKGYPALGREDNSWGEVSVPNCPATIAKFPQFFTAPSGSPSSGGRGYYDKEFVNGDCHFFFLDSGTDAGEDMEHVWEPPTSPLFFDPQRTWAVNKIKRSQRRWKIAVVPSPLISVVATIGWDESSDIGFESLGVDLIISGFQQASYQASHKGIPVLNFSCATGTPSAYIAGIDTTPSSIGGSDSSTYMVWKDTSNAGVSAVGTFGRLYFTKDDISYSLHSALTGATIKSKTTIVS